MKKIIILIIVVMSVMLIGCSVKTPEEDNKEPTSGGLLQEEITKIDELLNKDIERIKIEIETNKDLKSEYIITKNNEEYTITYTYEKLNEIKEDNIPEERKSTYRGRIVVERGKIKEEEGEEIDIDIESVSQVGFTFKEEYLSDGVVTTNKIEAKVSNIKGFLGKDSKAKDMSVVVRYTEDKVISIQLNYTLNNMNILAMYSFN